MEAQEVVFDDGDAAPAPNGATAVATRSETQTAVAAPTNGTAQIISMIERLTFDTNIPIERVQQSYAFLREVQADQAKKEFVAAFAKAQEEMGPVAKDANNPQTQSRYASLAALDRAIRPIYTKHGFSMSFDAEDSPIEGHVRVVCFLSHKSGHEKKYHVDMSCDGLGAKGGAVMTKTHAMGSAFSYGKRYLAGNVWNIASAEKDDDGNAAGGRADHLISYEQTNVLFELVTETGSDINRFLEVAKVSQFTDDEDRDVDAVKERLGQIKASQFKDLVTKLNMKKRLLTSAKGGAS